MVDVCLTLMPYAPISRPSIALGLLKACLEKSEIQSTVLYPNISFAEDIGLLAYDLIGSTHPAYLIGEWTFGRAAFPDFRADDEEYCKTIESLFREGSIQFSCWDTFMKEFLESNPLRAMLEQTRETATAFIDQTAHTILELEPRIVGCSSTLQQSGASLALLRRVHELDPTVITLIGGANCEGEMGRATRREFSWIDYVVSGEGEGLFPDLCRKLLTHGREIPEEELPYGVIGAAAAHSDEEPPRAMLLDIDDSPIPDYDDYFLALDRSKVKTAIHPALLFETSRGCWWGAKRHCRFCGLNGNSMTFRSKSSERVKREFAELGERYGMQRFEAVDNILDMTYFKDLIPELATMEEPYAIFYDTIASLKHDQLRMLSAAGVSHIQPGIESLHNGALELLGKATTSLGNLQLMKWSREVDIDVVWYFLVDFPGESDDWYAEIAEWLPMITHLQPPMDVHRIQYSRFSPYFTRPEEFGLELTPEPWYEYVYPLSEKAIGEIAHYFRNRCDGSTKGFKADDASKPGLRRLKEEMERWQEIYSSEESRPVLRIDENGSRLKITDTRPCALEASHTLEGLAFRLYQTCDRACSPRTLLRALTTELGREVAWEELMPILEDLKARRLVLELNGNFLSLAVGLGPEEMPIREYPRGYVDWDKLAALGYA